MNFAVNDYICITKQCCMENSIRITNGGITIKVSVFLFVEGKTRIAFCPSLDLCGYGASESDAKADFEYVITDWFSTQVANNTLKEDLRKHGWTLQDEHVAIEPSMSTVLRRSSQLKEIVKSDFKKHNTRRRIAVPLSSFA